MNNSLESLLSNVPRDRQTPQAAISAPHLTGQRRTSADAGLALDQPDVALVVANRGRAAANSLATIASPGREPAATPSVAASAPSSAAAQLFCRDLHKCYYKGASEVPVLRGVNFAARQGEFVAIIGQSGSGKSTLLHLLGTLDAPDAGEIYFQDQRIDNLPRTARDQLRNRQFGMIFQFYHLLPELSTLENVLAPLMIHQSVWSYFRQRYEHQQSALRWLETVGLGHRLKHKPRELSGGEMQRAAIARALIARPTLLLADEPTGNLDQQTGQEIIRLLRRLNADENLTIVMVTHDPAIAAAADRTVRLVDGRIAE